MPAAGLDISARGVKLIALTRSGGHVALARAAQTEIAEGVIVEGDIVEPDALVEVLRRLRSRYGVKFVHASLPEKKAFLYRTVMPLPHDVRALRQAIESELEEHVPLPPAETAFDFEIAQSSISGGHVEVAVTAYARRIVGSYMDVLSRAGLVPVSLEVESHALARAVVPAAEMGTVMAVDFGRYATRVAFVSKGSVVFTATIDIGGQTLTTAIMKQRNVTEEEATRLKNEQGIVPGAAGQDLSEALMISVSVLKDEISRHITYWNDHAAATGAASAVECIYLSGGNSNLRGLPEHLASSLGITTRVANVWVNAFSFDTYIPELSREQSLGFATAVGLALRSFTQ